MSVINLRPYQTEAVQSIYDYYTNGGDGNVIVVLPTGAGKSLTMAAFIRSAIEQYPGTKILLLAHVKELLSQNTKALIRYWPAAPVGIWSAGLGQKRKAQVTVAGIQSIYKLPAKFADTSIILVDECHLISRNQDTTYRKFIDGIKAHNPMLKIVGFTATEFRQDSGLLTGGDSKLFDDVCYKAEVGALIKEGYLCPLVAKNGATKADLSQVHTRGGEFVESELQRAMDKDHLIEGALNEVAQYAADRQHILAFTAGIEHAAHCAAAAQARGWSADYVSGDMAAGVRDAKIAAFLSGRTRFLFNAMLLTTGFDAPHIDCIVMLRPTKSTGLYVQIMGRGLRLHDSKTNTLVLDFAGNIERHGPIDQIRVKAKSEGKGEGVSVAPVKECPECQELVHTSVMVCPGCEYEWPAKAAHGTEAADAVIIAALEKPRVYFVDRIEYSIHTKPDKPPTMKVTYFCGLSEFHEYIPIEDKRSFVRKHAVKWFWEHGTTCPETVLEALDRVQSSACWNGSQTITVKPDGKYWRVIGRTIDSSVPAVPQVVVARKSAYWEAEV